MKSTAPVPGGPCRIEPSTSGITAATAFCTARFGRRCETDPREEAGGYTVAHLGGAPVAALSPLCQPGQPPAWTVSFAVEDADATAREATAAGGSLPVGPMDVFEGAGSPPPADPSGGVVAAAGPRLRRRGPVQRTGHTGPGGARHPCERTGARLLPGRPRPDGRRTRSGVSTGRASAAC